MEKQVGAEILVLKGKHGDIYYDVSTPERRNGAFVHIFSEHLSMGYYEGVPHEGRFKRALDGDIDAICTFVRTRVDHEYEDIDEERLSAFEVKNDG